MTRWPDGCLVRSAASESPKMTAWKVAAGKRPSGRWQVKVNTTGCITGWMLWRCSDWSPAVCAAGFFMTHTSCFVARQHLVTITMRSTIAVQERFTLNINNTKSQLFVSSPIQTNMWPWQLRSSGWGLFQKTYQRVDKSPGSGRRTFWFHTPRGKSEWLLWSSFYRALSHLR